MIKVVLEVHDGIETQLGGGATVKDCCQIKEDK
jgi:hypothetical protein